MAASLRCEDSFVRSFTINVPNKRSVEFSYRYLDNIQCKTVSSDLKEGVGRLPFTKLKHIFFSDNLIQIFFFQSLKIKNSGVT